MTPNSACIYPMTPCKRFSAQTGGRSDPAVG
jgi:hypothetical protein